MTDSEKLDQVLERLEALAKGQAELRTDVREVKIKLAHAGSALNDIIRRLAAEEVRAEMERENIR